MWMPQAKGETVVETNRAAMAVEATEFAALAKGWSGFRVVCQLWAAFSVLAFLAVLLVVPMEGKNVSPAWIVVWICSAIVFGGLSLAAGTAAAMLRIKAHAAEKASLSVEATSRRLTTV